MKVLFVCTGNSCRSPMAEGLFRHLLRHAGVANGVTVASVGTAAMIGEDAQPEVHEALRRHGVSLHGFRGRQLTQASLADADWVVCMSPRHQQAVLKLAPALAERTLLAAKLANTGDEVPDPFGGTVEDYLECYATLEVALTRLLELVQAPRKGAPAE